MLRWTSATAGPGADSRTHSRTTLTLAYRSSNMPYDGLSPDALKQIGKLEKKLSAFMEQQNHEITAIQSQIRELQVNKRTVLLDTEENFSSKKVKTENGNTSSDPLNLI